MNEEHTSDNSWQPNAKSRRCYHRVISGIERGGELRFLTLTSSKESPDTCQRSFRALYMRLRRRGLIEGYIKVPELSKNGKQHLHVLFRGKYIAQALVSNWWNELHHAKVVDIRAVNRGRGKKYLASYMAKYMSKDNQYRYSWNWDWVWRGFVNDWRMLKRLIREHYGEISGVAKPILLKSWRAWLHGTWQPDFQLLPQPP